MYLQFSHVCANSPRTDISEQYCVQYSFEIEIRSYHELTRILKTFIRPENFLCLQCDTTMKKKFSQINYNHLVNMIFICTDCESNEVCVLLAAIDILRLRLLHFISTLLLFTYLPKKLS